MTAKLEQPSNVYSLTAPHRTGQRATAKKPSSDAAFMARKDMHLKRTRLSVPTIRYLSRSADIIIAALVSWYFLTLAGSNILTATLFQITPFALVPIAASFGLRSSNAYSFALNNTISQHIIRVAGGGGIALGLLCIATFLALPYETARWPIYAALTSGFAILVAHAHAIVVVHSLARSNQLSENVVIVGATENAQRLIARNNQTRELNIVGIFDDRLSRAPQEMRDVPVLGRLDDLLNWEHLPEIDRIVVTVTTDARARVRHLIDRLRILPQRVVLLLDLEGFDPETESLSRIANSPAAYVSGAPSDTRRAVVKRASDIILATLMLIGFSPVFLIVAAAIKLTSSGPVFFRQRRHGFNNQIIKVWKFRSMRDDPDAAHQMTQQTEFDDPRVTTIGRFIRSTSIDELPQLLNVLKGEMSLVGPRPHAVGMASEETSVQKIVGDYAHRHRVKPGITGWAQINGSRGPVHTKELVRERVRLDMEYVNRTSLWLDLFIILMTAPCLLGDRQKVR